MWPSTSQSAELTAEASEDGWLGKGFPNVERERLLSGKLKWLPTWNTIIKSLWLIEVKRSVIKSLLQSNDP